MNTKKTMIRKQKGPGWGRSVKIKTCMCSVCGKPMDKVFGDQQIKNKRENAPICIPCCLGTDRVQRPYYDIEANENDN